jgi:signal transduction histidine kinase/CheY-like chemotaxis protein
MMNRGLIQSLADPEESRLGPLTGWWVDAASGTAYSSRSSGLYQQASLLSGGDGRRISEQGNWQLLAAGPRGTIWGSDSQRLFQVKAEGERAEYPPGRLADESIHALVWDPPTRRLWVGTNRGLLTWDPATATWGGRGLDRDMIFALQRDRAGMLWAATRNGIVRFDPGHWLEGNREADLRLTHTEGLRSVNFGMSRGQGSVLLADGRVLFASLQGVVAVNPSRIPSPRFGATPLISDFHADEAPVPMQSSMRIPPGTSRIKIGFDAVSVSTPRTVLMDYFLEGVDSGWQSAGSRRSVQYNNLGPGEYRFRVRSRWPDGSGAQEATVSWEIPPHFYQTAWFLLLAALSVVFLVGLLVRRRGRTQAQRTAELEARVEARTRELQAATASAEANARVKAEFLATMSHELRTPMNGVLGIAELLADTGLDPVQTELLTTLRSSGESLLAVVDDVLDLSKVESGRLELERIPVSLAQITTDLCHLVRPMAVKKGLALEMKTSGEAVDWVEGDPARLRQILLNLLSNAIKFTAAGKVVLSTEWRPGEVVLVVKDSGIGILPEKLPLLFQNFAQVDSSTTRLYGGTGLGLAICRRLAEAMGGSICCESIAGVGSTFTVRLPVRAAAAPVPVAPPSRVETPNSLRVLVAEDNPTNQRIIVGLLGKIGIAHVHVANNGLEAVEACQREAFDIVLMDCQMPILDGYSATRHIIHNLGQAAPPIVALTAHAMESDRAQCLAAGMRAYLTKPVILDQLRHVVNECCSATVR